VSVAGFIAAQSVEHGVPHATSCRALGMSQAWFYKWCHGDPSPRHARRVQLAAKIQQLFAKHRSRYGSPRITADLRDEGWVVSVNTVAKLMRELGLRSRPKRRRKQTTRQGKGRWRAPDLIGRDFAADQLNRKWYGDGTELVTNEGKVYLDTVLDAASRRIVGFAVSEHHDTDTAYAALATAVTIRGGKETVGGVILHTDQGSEFTAHTFRTACGRMGCGSRWAGSGRPWTTVSSSRGTPRWSSSYAVRSTSLPAPRPGQRLRCLLMTTTRTGVTPRSGCAPRSPTSSAPEHEPASDQPSVVSSSPASRPSPFGMACGQP
jgi:putative transposase